MHQSINYLAGTSNCLPNSLFCLIPPCFICDAIVSFFGGQLYMRPELPLSQWLKVFVKSWWCKTIK